MENGPFLLIAAFILGYTLISRRIHSTWITPAMVFVGFGWLAGDTIGWIEIDLEDELIRTIMELTLVLVLFIDASRIDLSVLRQEYQWPARMLSIGMPLTIAAGTVAGAVIVGLPFWQAAVLGVVLAPTDAALGESIVADESIPTRVRQTLNVESGLNDGIALPFLTIALALAGVQEEVESFGYWALFAIRQIGIGAAVGFGVALWGGALIERAHRNGWSSRAFEQLSSIGIALVAFALAEILTGNGFIASFVAGGTMGNVNRERCTVLFEFAEAEGQLFTMLTFLFFGAAAGDALSDIGGTEILYAVLSLTVIRMVPVALSLVGAGLKPPGILMLGWFGPRGVASILFALFVLEEEAISNGEQIFAIAALTVIGSVFLHGVSARPLGRSYSKWVRDMAPVEHLVEMEEMAEMPLRSSGAKQPSP